VLFPWFSAFLTIISKGLLSISSLENAHARRRARMDEESRQVRSMIPAPVPTSSAYTRIRGQLRNRACPTRESLGLPSRREQTILDQLSGNEGVSTFDLTSLFEKCSICDRYFIASLLRVHIRGCSLDI
jgi:hypothetical protein